MCPKRSSYGNSKMNAGPTQSCQIYKLSTPGAIRARIWVTITFQPDLEAQTLSVLAQTQSKLSEGIIVPKTPEDDYTLDLFDLVDALIYLTIATNGEVPPSVRRKGGTRYFHKLRAWRTCVKHLDTTAVRI